MTICASLRFGHWVLATAALVGCGSTSPADDDGSPNATDIGVLLDEGAKQDSLVVDVAGAANDVAADASEPLDDGDSPDAAPLDAIDATSVETTSIDTSSLDASSLDTSSLDASSLDASSLDTSSLDANSDGMEPVDAGSSDADLTCAVLSAPDPGAFGHSRQIVAAHFDSDGASDVAVLGKQARVALGNGKGGFTESAKLGAYDAYSPPFLAVGEATGDTNPDVLEAEASYPNVFVRVHPGKGDGTFADPILTPLAGPGSLTAFLAADLNGDLGVDAVVVGYLQGDGWTINVLIGNQDGTFGPAVVYPKPVGLGWDSSHFTAGDLDGDGDTDVALRTSFPAPAVAIYPGNGDGTLGALSVVAVDLLQGDLLRVPGGIALTGDTLVGITESGAVAISLAPAATATPIDLPLVGKPVAAGMLDGDAWADLVLAGDEGVALARGTSGGGYTYASADFLPVGAIDCAATVDLDGDGDVDIVASGLPGAPLVVMINDGDANMTIVSKPPIPGGPTDALAAGDLNGDGLEDLAAATNEGVTVTLSQSAVAPLSPTTYSVGHVANAVALADVDGDGLRELLVAAGQTTATGACPDNFSGTGGEIPYTYEVPTTTLVVRKGIGDGTFGPETIYNAGLAPAALEVADVDGDGLRDVIVANRSGGAPQCHCHYKGWFAVCVQPPGTGVTVLHGLASGSLGPPVTATLGQYMGSNGETAEPRAVRAADVTGDGLVDLVVGINIRTPYEVYDSEVGTYTQWSDDAGALTLLVGNGTGGFVPPSTVIPTVALSGAVRSLDLADIDGDGLVDAVVALSTEVVWLRGTGKDFANFQPEPLVLPFVSTTTLITYAGAHPLQSAVRDVNGDGCVDVLAVSVASPLVLPVAALAKGLCGGLFDPSASVEIPGVPSTMALADLDGNGSSEMVIGGNEPFLTVLSTGCSP